MSLKIKYQVIQGASIGFKAISLSKNNILAMASGQEQDWLLLFELDNSYGLKPIAVPTMEKNSISLLQWSPNAQYLATSYDHMIIWEFKNGVLRKYRSCQSHSLEITALGWSPDGTKIATTSLDGSIAINEVENAAILKKLEGGNKTVGISWDPFDKYVACLRFDNSVIFYRIHDWGIETTVNLSCQQKDIAKYTSKREDRKMDWSQDCRYLLVPNLDDKLIPTVVCLDRNQGFQVARTYIGPFSSINVIKFSPILLNTEDGYQSVFAMGDNDGNISVWKIQDEKEQDLGPLILLKGHKNSGELIEDICWNQQGNLMIASTSKRYVILVDFGCSLGLKVNETERQDKLKELYGNTKNTIKQVKIFVPKQIETNQYDDMQLEQIVNINREIQQAPIIDQQPIQTQFKTIIENGKKKVIPIVNDMHNGNVNGKTEQQIQQQNISLQPLLQIKLYQVLNKNYVYQYPDQPKSIHLELQKQAIQQFNQPTFGTLLRCFQGTNINWVDYVEGQVRTILTSRDYVIVYTDQNLVYVENTLGMRLQAPLMMPFVSYLVLKESYLLSLRNNGEFRVIDLQHRKIILEGDIKILMKSVYQWMERKQILNESEKEGKQSVDTVVSVNLRMDIDGYPLPEFLMRDYQVYTYEKYLRQWVRSKSLDSQKQNQTFQFNQTQLPQINENAMYTRLICATSMIDAINDVQQVAKLEEQIVQFSLNDDQNNYIQAVYLYFKKLCDTLTVNSEKLRNALYRYAQDPKAQEYQYIKSKMDMNDFKNRIVFILQQFPNALPFIEFLQ